MSAIWVEVVAVRGSAPRDPGTAMKVTAQGIEGTIGGGALEFEAISEARRVLSQGGAEVLRTYPLGPDLGQCCGGAVTLLFTRAPRLVDVPQRPTPQFAGPTLGRLWIWGAGHVGRAVVRGLPALAYDITWVDASHDRFPERVRKGIKVVPAADMPLLAKRAPVGAHHLIFTYSHEIDLALCAALLKRGAASIGLIGSETKKARFFKRLRGMGLDPSPVQCPIGDKALGKAPDAIARGVVAQLLSPETACG